MDIYNFLLKTPKTPKDESFENCIREIYKRFGLKEITIVETGCARNPQNSGDGWSSALWAMWAKECKGKFFSCDINQEHINNCHEILKKYDVESYATMICKDSIDFLKNDLKEKSTHVLFLDSFDTDENMLCCAHQLNEAVSALNKLTEDAFILLDDVEQKGIFTVPFLKANGFKEIKNVNNQMLLTR